MIQGIIYKRRCRRYVPTSTPNEVMEFLKDRYRQSSGIARPKDPFCHCGLLREEHHPDAIANAPPDFKERELRIQEPTGTVFQVIFILYKSSNNYL